MVKKSELAMFKLTQDEKAAALKAAQIERLSLSEFLRGAMRQEMKNLGVWPPAPPSGQAPAGGAR